MIYHSCCEVFNLFPWNKILTKPFGPPNDTKFIQQAKGVMSAVDGPVHQQAMRYRPGYHNKYLQNLIF